MYRFEITLEELTTDFIEVLRFGMANWTEELVIIDDEEDEDYFCDDVDESNYDPYLGCDFYDCGLGFFEDF